MSAKTNIRPLRDRVVVRRLEEERKTAGGIVIPDTATEKPMMGVVVALGPGRTLDNGQVQEPNVRVNDKVLFGKYAGTEVELNGETLIVMREDDIMAVIE
jgi:chaperonin GroES